MEHDFWKTSASSLREKITLPQSEKQKVRDRRKRQKNKEDSFQGLRQLENAYGKYVFGIKNDKMVIKVSRKAEYQEDTFDQSREELNENRLYEKKTSGAHVYSDSHKKTESAVIYEGTSGNISAERTFKSLKAVVEKENLWTLREMMPERADIEKRVFQSLKASVEAAKKEQKSPDSIPFWQRMMELSFLEDLESAEDEEDNTYSK